MTPDFTRFPILAAMILWLVPALLWFPAIAGAMSQKLILHDGDSFSLSGEEIRLWGIDAPEFSRPAAIRLAWTISAADERKNICRI